MTKRNPQKKTIQKKKKEKRKIANASKDVECVDAHHGRDGYFGTVSIIIHGGDVE